MATLLKQRRRVEMVEYNQVFHFRNDPGSGYGLPCDEQGNPENPVRFAELMAREDLVHDGVRRDAWSVWEPGEVRCDVCGYTVYLDDAWLNTCDHCGADYCGAGNRLAPRSQWGEETGESLADILIGAEVE